MAQPLERADPEILSGKLSRALEGGDREDVLVLNPADHRILGRRGTGGVRDHGPRVAVVACDLDPVGGADVGRVTQGGDAVGRHVLPLGAELAEFPVAPRLAVVGRETPAVTDGGVPHLALGPKREPVDEVERDRMRAGVARVFHLFPGLRAAAQHENAFAVCADPDRGVGRARECEHMDAEAARIGQRWNCLRGERGCNGQHEARNNVPHSAFHVPRLSHRALQFAGNSLISLTSTRAGLVTAHTTASATSSARIMSRRLVKPGFESGSISSQISVSTGPGEISVARTPVPDNSERITSCMPRRPYLLAAYAVEPGNPTWSDTEPIVTRWPLPFFLRCGTNARASKNGPVRLTARVLAKAASVVSSIAFTKKTPALLTTMSGAPKSRTTRAIAPSIEPASAISTGMSVCRSAEPSTSERAMRTTCAPAARSSSATASPIPRDAPVTTATFPASSGVVTAGRTRRAPGAGTRRASWRLRGTRRAAP